MLGVSSIALWRAYTGTAPETDRVVATRQLQARAAQASEQLVEKTKGLEATQQESIDQLQVVQDQLQTMRRLLAAQQADTKKLSEQVGTLTEAVEGLRQSFASAQASEPAAAAAPRKRSVKAKPRTSRSASRSPRQSARLIGSGPAPDDDAIRSCGGPRTAGDGIFSTVKARVAATFFHLCELVHISPRESRAS